MKLKRNKEQMSILLVKMQPKPFLYCDECDSIHTFLNSLKNYMTVKNP